MGSVETSQTLSVARTMTISGFCGDITNLKRSENNDHNQHGIENEEVSTKTDKESIDIKHIILQTIK